MTPVQASPAEQKALANGSGTGSDSDQPADARRTYRGRDLSEILPRIRSELGADAIVTHQREGLVGGIGGFFAHRFIEVEAMAPPPAPQLDLYDGEDADPLDELDGVVAMEAPQAADASDFASTLAVASSDGYELASDGYELASPEAEDEPTVELAAISATVNEEREPARAIPTYVAQPAFAVPPMATTAAPRVSRPVARPVNPRPYAPRVEAAPAPAPTASASRFSHDPFALRPEAPAAPVLVHSPAATENGVESAWIAGEAREAAEFMIARGMSAHIAEELIGEARSHDLPFAGAGGMRDALHACIARRLPRHAGLPRDGALIAIVGGGGSGKTRCAAALAASYSGASTLDVRAVSLGRYDSGAELAALVDSFGVAVQSAERGSRAAFELASSRDGMLVIADTPTVSPADPAAIGMLAVELEGLRPEEVLVTLAATSNSAAARQMLAALEPLHPTGIIVTHADETDQLGSAIELSLESGLPLVFIHAGLELPGALRPADPSMIAERLLS